MNLPQLSELPLRFKHLGLAILFVGFTITNYAQTNTPVLKVLKPEISEAWTAGLPESEKEVMKTAPPNFYHLGLATVGGNPNVQRINVEFSRSATITKITSTNEFRVGPESSCAAGRHYQEGSNCSLVVSFIPKGPGHRVGRIKIAQDQSDIIADVGLGGFGYAPVLSFIPSVITTVPGTYPSNVGLLSGAQNLAESGDTLLVADTGNGKVLSMDSGGVFTPLASGYTGALGVAADTFGQIYFDVPSTGKMYEIYDYGPVVQASGSGSASCPASTPCTLSSEMLGTPGEMSMDPYNHLFFVDSHAGAAFSTVQPIPANLIFLYDPFPYQQSPSAAMAVDSADNLYSLWGNGGVCEIVQQSLYNAENSNVSFTKVAGGHICGFNGDGGQSTNAQIGAKIGQITFDVAGNLYFSDSANQRVRRIDYTTGVIRTIAGNGTVGYTGDGGPATSATLSGPTGVAVDSEGQVYIISSAASGQVIREVGEQGIVSFPNQGKGTASNPQFVTISNTGNSSMTLTSVTIAGVNASNFKIDPASTNCNLAAGATLYSGQTCKVGVIFTPSATGTRQAQLTFLDNTIRGRDLVTLKGTGVLPPPVFTITSPTNGASFTSGTAVTLAASVTSTSGAQPTGTVQFKVDGASYGGPVTLSSTGAASTSVTGLTQTSHTLSATYSGDANYAAAGSISVSITVTASAIRRFPDTVPVDKGSYDPGGRRLKED